MFRAASQVLLTLPACFQTITDIKERRTKRLQPVLRRNLSPRGCFGRLAYFTFLYFRLLYLYFIFTFSPFF
jgi:hypothetical protein